MNRILLLALSSSFTLFSNFSSLSVSAADNDKADSGIKPVVDSIVVDEPQSVALKAIRSLRSCDSNRKVQSSSAGQTVIQEEFGSLPVLGNSVCMYKEIESPGRIDYSLISSNRFKMFEGNWTLTPEGKGSTRVTLTSYLDPGVRVPFWRELARSATTRFVHQRLEQVEAEAHRLSSQKDSKAP